MAYLATDCKRLKTIRIPITPQACRSSAACLRYIINSEGIAYHQHEVLHIIKPQGEYTLKRDEMQGAACRPLMICTARCAVMICQACGLDKNENGTRCVPFSFWRRHPDGGFAAYRHVRFRTMCPK